jgi:hypothetical protein
VWKNPRQITLTPFKNKPDADRIIINNKGKKPDSTVDNNLSDQAAKLADC